MPKNLPSQDSSQQRASKLLLAMGVIVLLGALAYFVLTLVVNRRTPANPDTHYTADNGIVLNYESAVWPVCEMAPFGSASVSIHHKNAPVNRIFRFFQCRFSVLSKSLVFS